MIDPNTIYEGLKFWLPLAGAVGIYFQLKKSVSGWANSLLDNHLLHIQEATECSAKNLETLNKSMLEHQEKQMKVWDGVVRTLDILEDRTARATRARARRRKK